MIHYIRIPTAKWRKASNIICHCYTTAESRSSRSPVVKPLLENASKRQPPKYTDIAVREVLAIQHQYIRRTNQHQHIRRTKAKVISRFRYYMSETPPVWVCTLREPFRWIILDTCINIRYAAGRFRIDSENIQQKYTQR